MQNTFFHRPYRARFERDFLVVSPNATRERGKRKKAPTDERRRRARDSDPRAVSVERRGRNSRANGRRD
eukprot:31197-Pelagococcus_subviridis.AAC.39